MQERLKLDLYQKTSISQGIMTRVNDGGQHEIQATALAYGDVFDLTGWKIKFELTTSAKTISIDAVNAKITTAKEGEFSYTIPKEITGAAGNAERAYFAFEKDDKRITSADINMTILQIVDITAEEARSYIAEYNKLVEELHAITDKYISDTEVEFVAIHNKIADLNTKIEQYNQNVKDTADAAIERINNISSNAITSVENSAKNAVSKIETSSNAAIKAVDDALKQFEAGDFYTKSETDTKFKVFNDLIVSQDIPAGANLDDYKKEGEFSKKTPTVVTGAPEGVTGAFRLSVRSMVGSSGIFQTLYDYATRAIYYRIGNTTLGFNLTWQRIANNSEVVHLAGDETIEGKKTFTGSLEAQLLSSDGTPLRTATFDSGGQALSTDRELTNLSMASGYTANAAEYCIKGGWIFITVQGARPTTNQTGASYYTFLKLPSEIVEHLSHTEAFMWSNFQGGGAAYSGGILNTGEVHLYASPSSVTIGSNHRYSFSMVIPMRTTK